MIERIVLLKLNPEAKDPATIREITAESMKVLPALPGVLRVHVGSAADERTGSSWDLSLVLRFEKLEDIPAFAAHPDHRTYVDGFLKPKIDAIAAFNFDLN